jgi:hypothetical protein
MNSKWKDWRFLGVQTQMTFLALYGKAFSIQILKEPRIKEPTTLPAMQVFVIIARCFEVKK